MNYYYLGNSASGLIYYPVQSSNQFYGCLMNTKIECIKYYLSSRLDLPPDNRFAVIRHGDSRIMFQISIK